MVALELMVVVKLVVVKLVFESKRREVATVKLGFEEAMLIEGRERERERKRGNCN